jgi:plastocyanin
MMKARISTPKAFKVVLLALLVATLWDAGEAATYTVQMTSVLTFDPNYLQIDMGDTVVWVNEDDFDQHDTTSTQGYWSSPPLDYGQTYSLTFPVSGTFPYEDSFYGPTGMTGTIVVLPIPAAPVLLAPVLMPNNFFQFTVTNLVVGQTNVVQASMDLSAWTGIYTNVASDTGYTFLDVAANPPGQFYRVITQP